VTEIPPSAAIFFYVIGCGCDMLWVVQSSIITTTLGVLAKPRYWTMKVKIAILTLMTFAALC
jgi:hypothetical protein